MDNGILNSMENNAITDILTELKKKFRETVVDRGFKRVKSIVKQREDIWEVESDTDLGDMAGKSYWVSFDGKEYRYHCDCYDLKHGDIRARSICSHVLAVIIYRKVERAKGNPRRFPRVR